MKSSRDNRMTKKLLVSPELFEAILCNEHPLDILRDISGAFFREKDITNLIVEDCAEGSHPSAIVH